MNKRIILNCLFLFICTLSYFSLHAQTYNIGGEAYIVDKEGQPYLINYDKEISLNGSVELTSSSYIYLTLQTNAEIKSIQSAGMLHIRGDNPYNLTIGNTDIPETGIQCDALVVAQNANLNITASSDGINSNSFIEIRGGNHTVTIASGGSGVETHAINASTFVTISGGTSLNAQNAYISIVVGSSFIIDGAGTSVVADGEFAGINCQNFFAEHSATVTASGSVGTSGSYGIKAELNIIADHEAIVTGIGKSCGIQSVNGLIRSNNAMIQGKRTGIDGETNAIHTPNKIYALNGGTIEETYQNAGFVFDVTTLFDSAPLLKNNIVNPSAYNWNRSPNVRTGVRNIIVSDEKVKIDSQSSHIIILNNVFEMVKAIPKKIKTGSDFSMPMSESLINDDFLAVN